MHTLPFNLFPAINSTVLPPTHPPISFTRLIPLNRNRTRFSGAIHSSIARASSYPTPHPRSISGLPACVASLNDDPYIAQAFSHSKGRLIQGQRAAGPGSERRHHGDMGRPTDLSPPTPHYKSCLYYRFDFLSKPSLSFLTCYISCNIPSLFSVSSTQYKTALVTLIFICITLGAILWTWTAFKTTGLTCA
jgi:hypothetical protein